MSIRFPHFDPTQETPLPNKLLQFPMSIQLRLACLPHVELSRTPDNMDLLSITTARVWLPSAVLGTSAKIVTFIRAYHDAKAGLECISEELSQPKLVIEL